MKEYRLNKNLITILLIIFVFMNGCHNSTNSKKIYDFRDYLLPKESQNQKFNIKGGSNSGFFFRNYDIRDTFITVKQSNNNIKKEYQILDSKIIYNNKIILNRYLKEGDSILDDGEFSDKNITFKKYYENKIFDKEYIYRDVIEIEEGKNTLLYFSKGIGLVATQDISSSYLELYDKEKSFEIKGKYDFLEYFSPKENTLKEYITFFADEFLCLDECQYRKNILIYDYKIYENNSIIVINTNKHYIDNQYIHGSYIFPSLYTKLPIYLPRYFTLGSTISSYALYNHKINMILGFDYKNSSALFIVKYKAYYKKKNFFLENLENNFILPYKYTYEDVIELEVEERDEPGFISTRSYFYAKSIGFVAGIDNKNDAGYGYYQFFSKFK